jgi:Fic family protein
MKLPLSPPSFDELIRKHRSDLGNLLGRRLGPEVDGQYEHWDHLRHLTPPEGLSLETWWLGIQLARNVIERQLPLRDKFGRLVRIAVTDSMQRLLHFLDQEAAGSIQGLDREEDGKSKERYLMRSLIEEAMTSSQLEGASTTREVAKELLRSGRAPRDRSEQMIYNNYQVMQELRRWRDRPLTPTAVFEMHRLLTADTMDDAAAAGRFRRADEQIRVLDNRDGTVLHDPPPAQQLPDRLEALCRFANGESGTGFLHPVIRAIALHYQLGYDHPFVDGNGRTARALFYWSMLRSGYWLSEYLSISSVLRKAPAQYVKAYLFSETDSSDLGYFASHQLAVLEQSVQGLRGYLARKAKERQQAESLLRPTSPLGRRLNHRQRALLVNACRHPDRVYRIEEHRQAHGVTYETARSDLLDLVKARLLSKRQDGRAFVFHPVRNLSQRLEQDSRAKR